MRITQLLVVSILLAPTLEEREHVCFIPLQPGELDSEGVSRASGVTETPIDIVFSKRL